MKDHISALAVLPPLDDATRRWSLVALPSKGAPVRVVATRGRAALAYEITYWTNRQLMSVDRSTDYAISVALGALTPTIERGELPFDRAAEVIAAMGEIAEPLGDAVRQGMLDGSTIRARDEGPSFDRAFSVRHPDAARFPAQARFVGVLFGLARAVATGADARWAFEPFT